MRVEYEMTEEDLQVILEAGKPGPCIMLQCGMPPSPQETANIAWKRLGKKMGFDHWSVRSVVGKGARFFTAERTIAMI